MGSSSAHGWHTVAYKGVLVKTTVSGDSCTFPTVGDWVTVEFTGSTRQYHGTRKDFSSGGQMSFFLDSGTVVKGLESGLREISLGERAEVRVAASRAVGGSETCIPKGEDMTLE
eukprot:COSAG02_NODE_948_length_15709_cov_67.728700_6_plen_114_part_00